MITIGIRAAPRIVTFAVYDSNEFEGGQRGRDQDPCGILKARRSKDARSNLLDVLREYKVERAGVRVTEPDADPNIERVQLEGVIQEAFASSDLGGYYVGQVSSISAKVGFPRTSFRPYVDGQEAYPVDNWTKLSVVQREAILTAIGAVNA